MTSNGPLPAVRLLSNGSYFVTITAAGTGQSRRHGHVVNRWHGDPVTDHQGQFIYLRDLDNREVWSAAMQPLKCQAGLSEGSPAPGSFRIANSNAGILSQLDLCVSPAADFEVRRLSLENQSGRRRVIEVTSFLEVVADSQDSDCGHPAFSRLFVQTSLDEERSTLIAERRPRSKDEKWPRVFHSLVGQPLVAVETDRLRFLGRGRSAANPAALDSDELSGSTGNVLDPCFSLRTVVEIEPEGVVEMAFITGVSDTRETVAEMVAEYGSLKALEAVFEDAAHRERELWDELEIGELSAEKFQALAAALYYGKGSLISPIQIQSFGQTAKGIQESFGIPLDRKQIVVNAGWDAAVTSECLKARRYWDRMGFFTNLIVLRDSATLAPQGLDDRVFTLPVSSLGEPERQMLFSAASLIVGDRLPEPELDWSVRPPAVIPQFRAQSPLRKEPEDLQFFNGYGGFSRDGLEYVIRVTCLDGVWRKPPMPWVNVIANERAGFLVSESGAACTWARNSQANRLTPWSNEPVGDPHNEALYLRDAETGEVWSPLPGPVPAACDYEVRHGLGYSKFLSHVDGLDQKVAVFMPQEEPVKIVLVSLTNSSDSVKRLSFASYQQIVLGSLPGGSRPIVTSAVADGSLRAVNPEAGEFRGGIAFAALKVTGAEAGESEFTCDRLAFLGRHGTAANPAGMRSGEPLDGATGAGSDPCFVQRCAFSIQPGESASCVVLLGEGMAEEEIGAWIARYGDPAKVRAELEEVRNGWRSLTGALTVETPSPILNILLNGWLVYQTLSCRIWARTAFYQSSGAFGFRDQLQDAGNLLPVDPSFARGQILLHARHQFEEGDVLHWWHPEPVGRGLRTRFADDLLWLPFVTADYIRATGDTGILDEVQPFLKAPLLVAGADENYLKPDISESGGMIYDHCCRAIERSLAVGVHGLPLMGTGDWNDGMNRVGREGRGESVWMGFFLYSILGYFIPLCRSRSDDDRAGRYEKHREALEIALNGAGWDGEWYRRAYYDNGDPLGSKENDECRIDALAQAWAIISKATPTERADLAMSAMKRQLISQDQGLIRLLTPPFVNTPNDPGYIKGYVAGIRENGGQYTHAACWAVRAIAEHGENNLALSLLEMLSPIAHSLTPEAAELYMVEPFVVAADVYGAEPHVGRGGWTWYTGSSGWLYRVAIESILGLRIEAGNIVVLKPCVPDHWPSFRLHGRLSDNSAKYRIEVENPHRSARQVMSAAMDGIATAISGGEARVIVPRDGKEHAIRVVLG